MNIALIGALWLALGVVVSLVFGAAVRYMDGEPQGEAEGAAEAGREATDPWTVGAAARRERYPDRNLPESL